jgi:two-component system OmpR family sensor kinase
VRALRSVGTRLTLALALAVVSALGVVYLIVVPSLQRNLVNAKLSQLRGSLPAVADELDPRSPLLNDELVNAAAAANARVVLYRVLAYTPPALQIVGDSRQTQSSVDVEKDPIALRALVSGARAQGDVERGDARYAEVARPIAGYVLLESASLHDSLGNVHLVQRRLLLAGLLALVAVLLLGWAAATVFARRIRRLEAAAERIAGGDFGEPVEDAGSDELGQLAVAFERMRLQLAQLDDARRAFIANASHELRTPLFSLGGFLELLDDEELDEPTRREFLREASTQVLRLQKLAVDLLDLSRLDAGKLRVEHEPVELDRLAEEVVREFTPRAARSGHALDVDAVETTALADAERVVQIARIFVENALVHTPPGSTVRVRTAQGDRGVELAVEDDGPGIPPAELERVFARFARLDGTVASGSGLGLAIARQLAALMGGTIMLESVPGRTVFALRLPAGAAEPFSRENVPVTPRLQ